MSAPLRGAKRGAKARSAPAEDGPLFSYEVRRDGRPIASLHAVGVNGGVTVETEVWPVSQPPDGESVRRPFRFASREAAQRFVDETLITLEYLNCQIVE